MMRMEMRFIILFNDNAPAELAELAVLHTQGEMTEAPAPGDTMKIGENVKLAAHSAPVEQNNTEVEHDEHQMG